MPSYFKHTDGTYSQVVCDDPVNQDGLEIIEAPSMPLTPPSLAQVQASLDAVVTHWIDAQARAAGFKDAAYLVSYYDSTNAAWKATAHAFVAWRDGIWTTCIAIVDAVKAGQRQIPTSAELLAELPPFNP